MHAFHWHIDVCLYILTMYAVYYVWLVCVRVSPRPACLTWNITCFWPVVR
jgi:hypothetical protein